MCLIASEDAGLEGSVDIWARDTNLILVVFSSWADVDYA